ncbi:uncharacterized protein LOC120804879 isoform X2 [Xiphias gladius]|nr:uncharacterized protein LOC120804879 isoform X2 [Xiphias gladius]
MDNCSIITKACRDLQVKCIVSDAHNVRETWVNFKITEEMKHPDPDLPTPQSLISSVSFIVIVIVSILISGVFICIYISWKKKTERQHRAATVPGFCRYLVNCCGLREGISRAERVETGETSIDPGTDGKTAHSHSLDRNSCKGGILLTENQQDMNRNLRDDPGGVNHNRGTDIMTMTEMHNGYSLGDRGLEDHETEGQLLLSNQRANIQGSDMRGEAAALVNKCGFDLGQVSSYCDAPDTDVESMPKMKNCSIPKY